MERIIFITFVVLVGLSGCQQAAKVSSVSSIISKYDREAAQFSDREVCQRGYVVKQGKVISLGSSNRFTREAIRRNLNCPRMFIASKTATSDYRKKEREGEALARLRAYDTGAPAEISGLGVFAYSAFDIDLCAYHQIYKEGNVFWDEIQRRGIRCTTRVKHDEALAKSLSAEALCQFLSENKAINYIREKNRRGLDCGVTSGSQVVKVPSEINKFKYSDNALCTRATSNGQWEKNLMYREDVLEAKRRGLDCGVGSSPQIAKAPIESELRKPTSQIKSSVEVGETTEIRALRERLATLEAEKNAKQQLISQDTEKPSLRITSFNSNGPSGTISGITTDNTGIAEVLVGRRPVVVDPSGQFSASIFVPSEGIDVEVSAYDLNGLATTQIIRLERSQRTQQVSRLAAVNPLVGPKQKPSRDRAALIIGLEKYAEAPPADYASRDAQMFADYAREKLGIAPGNIKVLTDTEATRSGLLRALKVWLPQAVQPDKTDLYVFYAGHGMASDDGESAYIVPYGADTFLLEDTAISRERFYDEIGAAKPRSATFFFDNCYAGTTRSEERLLAQRPLSIKVQESPVPDNYLVFTAGESNQTAGVLDEVKHGRFSYFVFKGLEGEADANSDGKISAGELHKYVRESVGRFSAGAQTPTMLGDAGRWVLR